MVEPTRTAIISPIYVRPGSVGISGDLGILNAARASILYWDFIDIPEHPGFRMPTVDQLAEFLKAEGAGSSFRYGEGPFTGHVSYKGFAFTLQNRMQESNNVGRSASLIQPLGDLGQLNDYMSRLLGIDQQFQTRMKTVELAILNSLPVPPPGSAFSDILAFKRRRADHLQLLWEAITDMAVQFSGADNIRDATELVSKKVSAALSEIDRVVKETWPHRLLRHINTNFESSVLTGAATGLAAAYFTGLNVPTAVSTAAAAATPVIAATLRETVSYRSAVPDGSKPFIYAYDSTRDFYRPSIDTSASR